MTDFDPAIESLIFERVKELKHTIDIDESNLTPIQEFYKDTKIFITGCTGFLGQILIEKLLRSCPVSTLYLLVRDKKGKSADARMSEIFETYLFTRMKKVCPDFCKKVVVIRGDCQLPELGLGEQDKASLINEVNIIFHVAATIRFDEKLNVATAINIRATKDISILAKQMLKLKSFVQVSTAYGNCSEDIIEEKIYPPTMKPRHLMQIYKYTDQTLLDILTPHFIKTYPNTYVFTKQIAEDVVKEEAKGLPAAIYRPSIGKSTQPPIVASTYREPIRGWINNIYGTAGIVIGFAVGLLRVVLCDESSNANIVPVDMCINGLIASAWDASEKFRKTKDDNKEYEIPVYNYESSTDKPITWRQFADLSQKYGTYTFSVRAVWCYVAYHVTSYPLYAVLTFFLHTIPGMILDAILFCKGKKMRMRQIYKKIHKVSWVLRYFMLKNFTFKSENVQRMLAQMSEKDREVFFCDFKELDWKEFFIIYLPGGRVHILKDPLETVPEGRRLYKKFKIAHITVKAILWFLALTVIWWFISIIYSFDILKTVSCLF